MFTKGERDINLSRSSHICYFSEGYDQGRGLEPRENWKQEGDLLQAGLD